MFYGISVRSCRVFSSVSPRLLAISISPPLGGAVPAQMGPPPRAHTSYLHSLITDFTNQGRWSRSHPRARRRLEVILFQWRDWIAFASTLFPRP
eukprot:7155304-Pyramimonas_sp.AAC.1